LKLHKNFATSPLIVRNLHITSVNRRFHEYDPKSTYRNEKWRAEMKQKNWEYQKAKLWGIKDGFKDVREEVKKWQKEVHKHFMDDSHLNVRHGDREQIFKFNTKANIDYWLTLSDSDHNEGYSKTKFELTPTGHGLFHGYVNTTLPKDGVTKKAGYCAIKSPRKVKSFYREDLYDWSAYSHVIARVRGDGRTYIINLATMGDYDILWNDIFSYVLHTRGGPYWQDVKIPFSKFLLSSKGRVQDKQFPIARQRISSVGITVGKVDGPFALEIDYIGVEQDHHEEEIFAYELYQLPNGIANV